MPSKKYTLVAWTEKGEVRMVPSLINDAAEPYRRRIAYLESFRDDVVDEVGWLIAQSRAHEAFARFLLSVGHPREAYVEFSNAAVVCTFCSDTVRAQGETCDSRARPLLGRFLAMHCECIRLAQMDKPLARIYEGSELQRRYLRYTRDSIEIEKEFNEVRDIRKAWKFGKPN